ncbi:MAG: thiolase domain-containing protein [Candidatus Geothermarchaeales archaeon]
MMRRVAVIGVGNSSFGLRADVTLQELAFEAVREALEDAAVTQREVELSVVGSVGTRQYELLPAVPINEYAGFDARGPIRVEAACATGSAAVYTAYVSVASGIADTAIAIGVEKMCEVDTATSLAAGGRGGNYLWEFHSFGTTFPAYYALYATAHMAKYGTTEEQMAKVAVKAHKYGAMNPKAHFQRTITIGKALESRVIAYPIRLYDCCPMSDGSAAVILASEEKARELKVEKPIWVEAMGYSSDTANMTRRPDYVGLGATVRAAEMAYKRAEIAPGDVDVATVHDCFTIAEIMAYEDLGFCKKGDGGRLIDEGQTEIGGRIPVNVDGGLKAKGHPLGATGCSMIYELTKQLRGEAGDRQVPLRNHVALAHNVGGTGHYCWVTILRG